MRHFIILAVLSILFKIGYNQENKVVLNLDDVIRLASEQSYEALIARHTFKGSYWEYRTFEAAYLPSLSLNGTALGFEHSISQEADGGEETIVERNNNKSSLNVALNQNIGFTGGRIFMQSNVLRNDQFNPDTSYYLSNPVSIGFSQPLFGYNKLKWDRKIEPLKYEEAKRNYIESLEQISLRAVNRFFDLSLAIVNLEIAKMNFSNTDTLFKISNGRFNIGTIAKNELLQMELSHLSAEAALREAELDLEIKEFALRSFLGYNETVDIELIIPEEVDYLQVDPSILFSQCII